MEGVLIGHWRVSGSVGVGLKYIWRDNHTYTGWRPIGVNVTLFVTSVNRQLHLTP